MQWQIAVNTGSAVTSNWTAPQRQEPLRTIVAAEERERLGNLGVCLGFYVVCFGWVADVGEGHVVCAACAKRPHAQGFKLG